MSQSPIKIQTLTQAHFHLNKGEILLFQLEDGTGHISK